MATLTATTYANQPRIVHNGVISVSGSFNSGATEISASATTVLLCKIPNKATILDVIEHHTTGAATCPVDIGVDDTLSAFVTQATQASVTRATVGANLPYTVSKSDDVSAASNFATLKATYTPGTATASLKCNFTVLYTMDK